MSASLAVQPENHQHHLAQHLMDHTTDELVIAAQQGDGDAREYLIRSHWDFVRRVASRVAKRSIHTDDDLWSVAIIAFNEAIDPYDVDGGASFRTFANTVISRRLIDRFRRRAKNRDLPLTTFAWHKPSRLSGMTTTLRYMFGSPYSPQDITATFEDSSGEEAVRRAITAQRAQPGPQLTIL